MWSISSLEGHIKTISHAYLDYNTYVVVTMKLPHVYIGYLIMKYPEGKPADCV